MTEVAAVQANGSPMVLVENLVKRFAKSDRNAVDGVSFTVPRGEIFGLLGPNGAGKSTTIGVLTTRIRPSSGRVSISGVDLVRDPVAAKRRFALVPQHKNLDRLLTARQNLTHHGAYFGFSRRERERRADALLEEFGLEEHANRKTDDFSGGMAQRLMIARALMHDPELIFLDEPATGLDPAVRLFVWDRIRDLHGRGLTVLITTHDMVEADTLCERIAIMDHGKILADDTPQALRSRIPGGSSLELRIEFEGDPAGADGQVDRLVDELRRLPGVERAERVVLVAQAEAAPDTVNPYGPPPPHSEAPPAEEGLAGIRAYSARAVELISPALEIVGRSGASVRDVRISEATLEDVFISLTGRALRGG